MDVAKARFESFYLPFLKLYIRNSMWAIRLSEISIEARDGLMHLVIENLQHTSFALQRLVPDLYTTHLELIEHGKGNSKYKPSLAHIDNLFHQFAKVALFDYQELAAQLKLPTPAMPPLPIGAQLQPRQ